MATFEQVKYEIEPHYCSGNSTPQLKLLYDYLIALHSFRKSHLVCGTLSFGAFVPITS